MSNDDPLSIDVKPSTSTVSEEKEDWYGQHQWQCGYERGWDKGYEAGRDNRGKEEKNNWVGLTDEEIEQLWNSWLDGDDNTDWGFERSIEAKLKEKNSG
jgi:hypothetical protein